MQSEPGNQIAGYLVGQITVGTVLLQSFGNKGLLILILAKLLLHQSFVVLRTNSFHCCDGKLFVNLNCRVAKCAN
jgi:hypothetical protein